MQAEWYVSPMKRHLETRPSGFAISGLPELRRTLQNDAASAPKSGNRENLAGSKSTVFGGSALGRALPEEQAIHPNGRSGFLAIARTLRSRTHWVLLVIALAVAPRAAWAHAHLVRSTPAAGAHLATSPAAVRLWYSEAAEATMTTITLTGPSGTHTLGLVKADPADPLLLVATIEAPLPAGRYTVHWRTVAKDDGHPSSGSFAFVVTGEPAGSVGASGGTAATAPMSAAVSDSASAVTPAVSMPQGMSVEAPGYVAARWLEFVALIMVVGAAAFALLVLPRVETRAGTVQTADFNRRATARSAKVGLAGGVAFLIASVCRLYAERAVVGGNVAITTVLQSTWGRAWTLQSAIAIIACVAFAVARRSRRGGAPWLLAAIAAIALAATPAFSGHAIAAPANRTVSVTLDVIHVIAAGGWLGGLLVLAIVGVPSALSAGGTTDPDGGLPLVATVVNAFSPLALIFAGLVVASGVTAAWLRIGSFAALLHSSYGTVLLVKLGLVLLVIAGGAFNWLRMRHALANRETGVSSVGAFRRSAWLELTAGALVIAATAVLVATQPPVH